MVRRRIMTGLLAVAVGALLFETVGVAQKPSKVQPDTTAYRVRQERPIKLGTSGGNVIDIANGYCCSGTLGALVQRGSVFYILSNTHVLAGDSEAGGNGKVPTVGDDVSQPGLIEVGCAVIPANYVADLAEWAPLGPNANVNVDAAIAAVRPGTVDTTGAILGIGTVSSIPVPARVGQKVQKSGRTTGKTTSMVSGLNASLPVTYEHGCNGSDFTVAYTGQILVKNRGSSFLAGGDSGSLMVEDVAGNPRPVGLLFAGSSSIAVANPIQDVLNYLGVTLVGEPATAGTEQQVTADPGTRQALSRAIQVQERHGREFMRVPGVVGHAVGLGNGAPVIQVLVESITPAVRAAVRDRLEGVPVVLEEVGQIRAMPACTRAR